jgi:hypothetical protein
MEAIHAQPNGNSISGEVRSAESLQLALKLVFRKVAESPYLQILWDRVPENGKSMKNRRSGVTNMRNRPTERLWHLLADVVVRRWFLNAGNRNVGL